MSKELTDVQGKLPITPVMKQTGATNVHVTNQDGGTVNINYNILQPTANNSAELLIAVQSFSKEYYQLIVTCEDDVFTNHVVTVSTDRALNQYLVPPEILDRCSSLSDAGIAELKTFPALICRENTEYHGITDPNQWAIYGYIKRIKKSYKSIKIAFQPIASINQQKLCEKKNAIYFDLNMDCAITDLNRSAWSVHKVNLFEAFKVADIMNMPQPV